jgi:hypothetical protein
MCRSVRRLTSSLHCTWKRPNTKEVLNDNDKDLIRACKVVNRSSLPQDERERNVLLKKLNECNKFNERLTNFSESKGPTNIERLGKAIVKYCATS